MTNIHDTYLELGRILRDASAAYLEAKALLQYSEVIYHETKRHLKDTFWEIFETPELLGEEFRGLQFCEQFNVLASIARDDISRQLHRKHKLAKKLLVKNYRRYLKTKEFAAVVFKAETTYIPPHIEEIESLIAGLKEPHELHAMEKEDYTFDEDSRERIERANMKRNEAKEYFCKRYRKLREIQRFFRTNTNLSTYLDAQERFDSSYLAYKSAKKLAEEVYAEEQAMAEQLKKKEKTK